MRTLKRSKAIAAIAVGFVVTGGGVAVADNLLSDGDDLVAIADTNWAVGSVCSGASDERDVAVRVSRQGNATATNTYKAGTMVSVSGTTTSAVLTVESGTKTITLPSNWETSGNNTLSSSVSFEVGYTAPTALGPFSGTVTFAGSGVNSSNVALNRTDGLTVSGTVVACDSTPPVITPQVSGTLGSNGWYTSDIDVSWDVTDAESAISSRSGCDNASVTTDTGGTTFACQATSAGGTGSGSVTIKRDAAAPVISGSDVNDTTWRNTSRSESFTASDATSGLANSADASFTLTASAESAGSSTPTTVSKTVSDAAGNSSTRSLSALIDKTAPDVSVTGVSNGTTYTLGSVPTAGCTTSDSLSGVASQATPAASGGAVGSVTVTCSGASDNAGNTGSAGATYNVVYDYSGFFQPIDNNNVLNKAKAGSAIPIKFSLGGDQGLAVLAGQPTATKISCSTSAATDMIEEIAAAGASGLKYDAATGQYAYNWKTTSGMAGTCQKLTVKFVDGTSQTALFNLTK